MKKTIALLMIMAGLYFSVSGQSISIKESLGKSMMPIGSYYYPEHWKESEWELDLKKMAALGFEFTHLGEFAWARMEPEEDRFTFDWLDKVVELAAQNDLKIIMCTPTPTPPAWLTQKHPEILSVNEDFITQEHGGRLHVIYDHPVYQQYVEKIILEMAKRYGNHPAVAGWQLDNEPHFRPIYDYSDFAKELFPQWLKEKYGNIENLNQSWGTAFWSQTYNQFAQITLPNKNTGHTNPHAQLDFMRFTADRLANGLRFQADLLRENISKQQWITTNYAYYKFLPASDPFRNRDDLDFASHTMYLTSGFLNDEGGPLAHRLGSGLEMAFSAELAKSVNGETAILKIALQGGMYTDFYLKNNQANPFTWAAKREQMPANNQPHVFKGHFLCTGRWGAPSKEEIEMGIPHNGEVNTQRWEITQPIRQEDGMYQVEMSCTAPREKLDVTRTIKFSEEGSYYIVSEAFTNNLPVGKQSNFVQHPTIAAPFLTQRTIINTNAGRGFDQRTPYDSLETASFSWPNGKMADGSEIDLQTVTSEKGYVSSHIFPEDEKIGWITALNPDKNLLFGYIWKTAEYPWLNVWHHSIDGKPFVQGLEFGTTGLGQPYKFLLENRISFFGRNSFEFIEAGETKTKSFVCFQIEVPEGFEGVAALEVRPDKLELRSFDGELVQMTMPGDIFLQL